MYILKWTCSMYYYNWIKEKTREKSTPFKCNLQVSHKMSPLNFLSAAVGKLPPPLWIQPTPTTRGGEADERCNFISPRSRVMMNSNTPRRTPPRGTHVTRRVLMDIPRWGSNFTWDLDQKVLKLRVRTKL